MQSILKEIIMTNIIQINDSIYSQPFFFRYYVVDCAEDEDGCRPHDFCYNVCVTEEMRAIRSIYLEYIDYDNYTDYIRLSNKYPNKIRQMLIRYKDNIIGGMCIGEGFKY
jgi:hypothetical protein